jgi:hypothetical protein
MLNKVAEKYIKASNLIFWVAFLKLTNVVILDIIPTGKTSLKMAAIVGAFIVFGFVMRKGLKWIVYITPLIMLFPWILLKTNIIHIFDMNPLAAIVTGMQFLLQIIILDILVRQRHTASSAFENRGRYINV